MNSVEVDTLAAWIEKSGTGYLEGAHQTCLLLGKVALWDAVAVKLVHSGRIDRSHRRYVSDAALAAL